MLRPAAGSRGALGAEARLIRVLQTHRFAELDPSDLSTELFLTGVRRGDTWRIAEDTDGEAVGVRSGRDLWDFGPVTVVRGERHRRAWAIWTYWNGTPRRPIERVNA